ncbi:MAG: hypothetical protein LBS72_00060, partial [Oscillospiraceae bacterium]|nr:hypothetical protein [Oscillospiraceae bacterium]
LDALPLRRRQRSVAFWKRSVKTKPPLRGGDYSAHHRYRGDAASGSGNILTRASRIFVSTLLTMVQFATYADANTRKE